MEVQTFFYIGGGLLVAAALLISFIGIRGKDSFPPSRGVMSAGIAVFLLLVAGTAAYAVASARDEQEHREEEQAHEEAEAAEGVASEGEGGEKPEGGAPPAGGAPAGGPAISLDVTSPEDGSLEFEPPRLAADAGTITLAYDNPSPVTHNIFLQDTEETVVAQSDDIAGGTVEISAELTPGEYFYYCAIPGHRDGGMEGTLTVQ